jgi:hypothetical protein
MKKNRLTILFFLSFISLDLFCFGEESTAMLMSANIPDSLKNNAYAVVKNSTTVFEYQSATSGIMNSSRTIVVLSEKGNSLANFYFSGDRFNVLNRFSAKLYDTSGKLLRKYDLSDVASTEWSSNLASDARHYFFSCDAPSIPYTICYEYEIKCKNGLLSFPLFCPQTDYNLSVEKASYQLILPASLSLRYKALNMEEKPSETVIKDKIIREWHVEGLKPIEEETFDATLDTYVPILYNAPQNFIYDGVAGCITDWKSFGKWNYDLVKNRDDLPETTKQELINMTQQAISDLQKVKILYDYLGKTTHYVSIQLGIGGFQPMKAFEVDKTKFGDCKALTNYLLAMLKAVGISSNYCIIRLDENKKKFFADYANFNQLNHVILQVPLPNDTLWLECTNPNVPFGFVHNGISGHDVIVCTAGGGVLQQLPDYPDSLNLTMHKTIIELNEEGNATVNSQLLFYGKSYDNNDDFPLYSASKQADFLRNDINLPDVTIGTYQFREDKSFFPNLSINSHWSTILYGTKTGSRMFIPVNPYQDSYYRNIKKAKRIHDLERHTGYKDIDSICIYIPKGYEIETLPQDNSVSTPFGKFVSRLIANEKEVFIRHEAYFPSGKYKCSEYPDFIDFYNQIRTAYNSKIIFRKKAEIGINKN